MSGLNFVTQQVLTHKETIKFMLENNIAIQFAHLAPPWCQIAFSDLPVGCIIIMGRNQASVSIICPLLDVNGQAPIIPLIEDLPHKIVGAVAAWHAGSLLVCGGFDGSITVDTCWRLDWVQISCLTCCTPKLDRK